MNGEDPWAELGLRPGADAATVRAAYLRAVKAHHPDRFRTDPARFRAEEERMKRINAAYRRILEGAAAPPPPDPPPPRPGPVCSRHGGPAVTTCQVCGTPLCPACEGWRERRCYRHRRAAAATRTPAGGPAAAAAVWVPLLAGVAVSRMLGFPLVAILLAVGLYLTVLGARRLWRWRWLGIALMVFFPYSMPLAGVYTLFTALGPGRRRAWS
ncbi:MAG: J domain-containing protein [Firmicutes bacterium]|nr:J domain-containing protein [Bacillota bacterium]